MPGVATAAPGNKRREIMSEIWLPSLITPDPQSGFDLAVKLSRMAVKQTQPSDEIRTRLRDVYADDADALIRSSAVVAANFQTVAAANRYWSENGGEKK